MSDIKPLATYLAIAISSAMVLLVLPVLIGGIDSKLNVTTQQLGLLAAADMLGAAAGALFLSSRMHLYSWRTVALISVALLVSANAASVFIAGWGLLLIVRFVAGLGAGGGLAVGNAGLATLDNADRNIAIYVVIALGVGAVALRVFSAVVAAHSVNPLFLYLAFTGLLGLAATFFLDPPSASKSDDMAKSDATPTGQLVTKPDIVAGVLGILVFFVGVGATWGYMQKIGEAASLVPEFIGNALGLGSIFGAVGGLGAIFLSTKFGRLYPVVVACGFAAAALVALMFFKTSWAFLFAVAAVLAAWNFSWPYMVGAMASADPTARLVSLAASMQLFGFALAGPIGGFIVGGGSYFAAAAIGVAGFALSGVLLVRLLKISDVKP